MTRLFCNIMGNLIPNPIMDKTDENEIKKNCSYSGKPNIEERGYSWVQFDRLNITMQSAIGLNFPKKKPYILGLFLIDRPRSLVLRGNNDFEQFLLMGPSIGPSAIRFFRLRPGPSFVSPAV